VIADFRIQLGIHIDNLSSVYHFGKVPNRTRKSSAGKVAKTYKAPKKKLYLSGLVPKNTN
jgi:hypothetical protein